ncbi:GNAT family N-acetyltransferase [Maricaulis sp. D1M11]|uniref:GNAT family N-acetyltransferase n=1 Tax=Maricaulis sp. D1M11 TaxID=3076117 RepID=UPI0039B5D5FE
MDVSIERPSALSAAHRQAWQAFQRENIQLASPYFTLEFADLCERVRPDTQVCVVTTRGQVQGFLPFHAGRTGIARPLAGPLGDVHGLIEAEAGCLDAGHIIREAGLGVFEYHSALASQCGFSGAAELRDGSWQIELSQGFAAWQDNRRSLFPKAMRNLRARRRRLEALDAGYEFVMDDRRPAVFEAMLAWKRQQYRETGVFDVFSVGWSHALMRQVFETRTDALTGLSSALYIGGRLAAVHIGMASDRLCHYWFPAYDRNLSHLSPGLLLLEEMIRAAASMGHSGVELGPGDYQFKRELATVQTGLVGGALLGEGPVAGLRRTLRPLSGPGLRRRGWRKMDRLAGYHGL